MKGKFHFSVSNKRLRYEFDIRRNITIIKGNSATGKTTLLNMLDAAKDKNSGVTVKSDIDYFVYFKDDKDITWQDRIKMNPNRIIFIEEGNNFVKSDEFSDLLQETGVYVVIICRDSIESLPYSVKEIYEIRESNNYGNIKQVVNELSQIYGYRNPLTTDIKKIITEDSNSGNDFFSVLCNKYNIGCDSAHGKSNVKNCILGNDNTLFIVDGAAFGSNIEECVAAIQFCNRKCCIWFPESFEFIILNSGIIKYEGLNKILHNPELFVDSSECLSWERFFTRLITDVTENTEMKYKKKKLNDFYKSDRNVSMILKSCNEFVQNVFKYR